MAVENMVWMEDADVAKGTGLRQSILPCDPKNQQATNNRALFQQHLFEFISPYIRIPSGD